MTVHDEIKRFFVVKNIIHSGKRFCKTTKSDHSNNNDSLLTSYNLLK